MKLVKDERRDNRTSKVGDDGCGGDEIRKLDDNISISTMAFSCPCCRDGVAQREDRDECGESREGAESHDEVHDPADDGLFRYPQQGKGDAQLDEDEGQDVEWFKDSESLVIESEI